MGFTKKVLANGLTVLHEKRDIPVTTVIIAAKTGFGYESAEEKGIAHFIEHMAFKGTEKRNAEQIAAELEGVGGEMNAFTADEVTAFHVKLPSRHLALGMDVLSDIFFNPVIDQTELEKERKVILEEIKIYHDDPRRHVFDKIKELSYEKPFGLAGTGTPETLKEMKREDLLKFHEKNYVSGNTIVCVVGNNELDEVLSFVEKMLVREGSVENKISVKRIFEKNTEKRVGVQQSNLLISIPAPKLNEENRYAAYVFANILGEGMSSRLFKEIREKR